MQWTYCQRKEEHLKKGFLLLIIFFCAAWLLYSPVVSTSDDAKSENVDRGRMLYYQYCASCHGDDALGNGAAAAKKKCSPPSLKNLKGSDGKFSLLKVQNTLKGNDEASKRGSSKMPNWEKYFENSKDKSSATLNIYALAKYLEAFQPQ
jgi:mono/diheme cytochrome c family protein